MRSTTTTRTSRLAAAILSGARKKCSTKGGFGHEPEERSSRAAALTPDAGPRRMRSVASTSSRARLAMHAHPNLALHRRGHARAPDRGPPIEKKRASFPRRLRCRRPTSNIRRDATPQRTSPQGGGIQPYEYRAGEMFINAIGDVHQSYTRGGRREVARDVGETAMRTCRMALAAEPRALLNRHSSSRHLGLARGRVVRSTRGGGRVRPGGGFGWTRGRAARSRSGPPAASVPPKAPPPRARPRAANAGIPSRARPCGAVTRRRVRAAGLARARAVRACVCVCRRQTALTARSA